MAIKDNVQGVVLALFGASAGGHLTSLTGTANANGLSALAGELAGSAGFILGKDLSTAAAFRDNMLTGLGISSTNAAYADAAAWADTELAKPAANRGEIVATAVTYLAGLTDAASPFFAAATAFNTKVAAAVTWSEGAGATVFGVAALQAQQGTPVSSTGETFTLTAGDDTIAGTAGADTINAASAAISTNDEVDGGAGNDTLIITAKGDVAALDVSNVENVNFIVRTFASSTLDAANISNATITVSNAGSGFSTAAVVDNAGDNTVTAGSGIATLTVGGSDEGLINVGAAATVNVEVSAVTNDLLFGVTDTSNAVVADSTTTSTATSIIVSGGLGTLDVSGMEAAGSLNLADVELGNGAKLIVDIGQIDTTNFQASGTGILAMAAVSSDATIDLEDSAATVTYQINALSTHTLAIDNADGKTFILGAAQGTAGSLNIDTTDTIGAGYTVKVDATGASLAVGTNTDEVEISLNKATAVSFQKLTIDGDVYLNTKAVNFVADATGEMDETDTDARLFLTGSGTLELTDLDLSYVDASAETGQITLDVKKGSGSQVVMSGSGNDFISVDAGSSAALDINGGAGNDRFDLTSKTTGDSVFDGGAGNDTFVIGSTATAFADGDANVIIGGADTDTISFNVSAGAIDGSAATTKIFISEVEVISVTAAATSTGLTLAADQLSGDTLELKGGSSTSANEYVTIATDANDVSINLSTVTVADSIDNLTIDASTALATTTAISITTTNFGETINVDDANTKGVTINAGAGDDTIAVNAGTIASVYTFTGGAGDDTYDLSTAAVVSTATKGFVINDYSVGNDTILLGVGVEANTGAPVDVKAEITGASELNASITGGIVTLTGASASMVDTVAEWIEVVELAAGTTSVAGFVFNGDTYVIETGAADAHTNVIKLVGVTGAALGAAGVANILIG